MRADLWDEAQQRCDVGDKSVIDDVKIATCDDQNNIVNISEAKFRAADTSEHSETREILH